MNLGKVKTWGFLLPFWLFAISSFAADEALRVWDYRDLADIQLPADNPASMCASSDVKTPDGQSTLEIRLAAPTAEARPEAVQVRFIYPGGLKAGRSYVVRFLCKASVPGTLQAVVALPRRPWDVLPGAECLVPVSGEWKEITLAFTTQQEWHEALAVPRLMLGAYSSNGQPAILHLGPLSLREAVLPLPLSLGKVWRVLIDPAEPCSRAALPQEWPAGNEKATGREVALSDGRLDIAAFAGGFKEKRCALLYNQFSSPAAGRMRIGVAADWWLALYVNGLKVYDNRPAGNVSEAFTPDDHVIEFPVRAGHNLLVAEVLSGSEGWRFVYGAATRDPDNMNLLTIRTGPDWKPVDMTKLLVKPGTALDFSELTGRRRPAGEFGRVIVNPVGKLAFEKTSGQPVRFLSYNTLIHSWRAATHTWSKKDIEEFADGVARQGYNMLRLHGNDRFLLGFKVHDYPLRSVAQAGIPQRAEDFSFDPGNVDRFDYLFACLKKNGIYVNLDLMTSPTGYTMAFPGQGAADESFRIQLFFNPVYRRHWAAAVGYLLSHVNPYTGLCLKDDPALAIVEPYNEQDLLLYEKSMIRLFARPFTDYLRQKYQTDEALKKAWGRPDITLASISDLDEDMLRRGDAMANDAGQFLIQTMSEITDWYSSVLRQSGYPGLVTQWDMIMRTMEMPVRAKMPAIAQHTYCAHPHFNVPTKNLVKKSAAGLLVLRNPQFDMMVGQDSSLNSSYFRAAAALRFLDRPFLITEYSHGVFCRYRHERGLYFGAYAALQGWDCLTAQGSMPVCVPVAGLDPIVAFENPQDPISRASEAVVALAWLRGDVAEAPHTVQVTLTDQALFPKHFLAAIGDDYAKLAMLTRIGVVYPSVKPFSPVGKIKADLELTPTEFSPMKATQAAASVATSDGPRFNALLRQLQAARLLPAANRTDYARRLYQSETGEIMLDCAAKTMAVITPRLEGAIVKQDGSVVLGRVTITACSKPASVVVASLDNGKAVETAKRLLLVFSTNALNDGMTFENDSMLRLAEIGRLPVLMETARLAMNIQNVHGAAPMAYALALDGTRAEQIPCEAKDGRILLVLDTRRLKYATPFFEIVFP